MRRANFLFNRHRPWRASAVRGHRHAALNVTLNAPTLERATISRSKVTVVSTGIVRCAVAGRAETASAADCGYHARDGAPDTQATNPIQRSADRVVSSFGSSTGGLAYRDSMAVNERA